MRHLASIYFGYAIILALQSVCCYGFAALGFRNGLRGKVLPSSSQLGGTHAKETAEVISPVMYADDLYSVLGLQMDASKREIKEAYWKIAAPNHPDRNKSDEALYIFRNASYAYSILGKSSKARAKYDSELRSKIYGNLIGEIGNDVFLPLAKDVALPLLNFTINSIGYFAGPILRNAYESTTAVFEAVNSEEETMKALDIFSRAGLAIERTSYDQKIRKLNDQIERMNRQLEHARTDLEKAKIQESHEEEELNGLIESAAQEPMKIKELEKIWTESKARLASTYRVEIECLNCMEDRFSQISNLEIQYQDTTDALIKALAETSRLEAELAAAISRADSIQAALTSLEEHLHKEKSVKTEVRRNFLNESTQCHRPNLFFQNQVFNLICIF